MNRQEAIEKANKATSLLGEALQLIGELKIGGDIHSNISEEFDSVCLYQYIFLSMDDEEFEKEYGDNDDFEDEDDF